MTDQVRRTQVDTPYPAHTLACIGDSLTLTVAGSTGVQRASDYWPEVVAKVLRAAPYNCLVKARNFGISGHTSLQIWERFACMTMYEVPDIACIWTGTNDPGNSIPQTGGSTAVPSSTQTYIQAMIDRLLAAGCKKIVVLGNHFLNYSSGGDTSASTLATCAFAAIIAAQQAAAATFASDSRGTVVFCDLFTYVKSTLGAGIPPDPPALNAVAGNKVTVFWPQYGIAPTNLSLSQYPTPIPPTTYQVGFGSDTIPAAPHGFGIQMAATGDLHYNEIGNVLVANALLATLVAQSGWLTALAQ
jgi:lysophospholipase L1-like esterase